jgi:hypothetical protein
MAAKKKETSVHLEFAEKSQLLRWFNDRNIKELKAMKKGFMAIKAMKEGTK